MFSLSRSSVLLALFAGATVLPSFASAQGQDTTAIASPVTAVTAPEAPLAPDVQPQVAGPVRAQIGITSAMALAPVVLPVQNGFAQGQGLGRNGAMMGVGLAAVVVGLVLDGDVGTLFVVGGALVGLVGLFRYMQ